MRNLIEGYNELEEKLGYEPNFHDDTIEKIVITRDRIEFILKTESGVVYDLIFDDVKEINNFEGDFWGEVGIIFDLEIKQIEEKLKTKITASLGLEGEIISKRIIVK